MLTVLFFFFANNYAEAVCFMGIGLSPHGGHFMYFVLLILVLCAG
jgi:hypothetical protein